MAKYENNTIIMAVFENESAAVGALSGMEHWAKSRRDIKLGAVGALQMEDGEVTSTLLRKDDKGVLVNGAVGLAKSLLGPIAVVGDVVGGMAKSVFGSDDEETPEAFQKLGAYMDAGGVTMVMVTTEETAQAFSRQLQAMGGRVTTYLVPQEVLEEAAAAVEEAQENEQ